MLLQHFRGNLDSWDPRCSTGFLKSGSRSAGVQRQYTGTAGKITNALTFFWFQDAPDPVPGVSAP